MKNLYFCSMKPTLIYHGSNVVVEKPKILISGFYKDFGYGFYCTRFEKQAQRWALSRKNGSEVSVYEYVDVTNLKKMQFSSMTDQWLDFVVDCRRGVEHSYDIVEGPMADDQIWDYVEDFASGSISREAFWTLVKFKYPTNQIVFATEAALQSITYLKSYSL